MGGTRAYAENPVGWTLDELERWVAGRGLPLYRARQAAGWIFGRGETDPQRMTTLPPDLRRALGEELPPRLPERTALRRSADGTVKFLLGLADGESVEMVLIPEGKRRTLCVSTQVGCPVGCLFCRTGQGGLIRNLETAEIVGQVLLARRFLEEEGEKLSGLVIMGMGEPLLNYERTVKALEIITAPWGLHLPARRITLSTAGVAPRLAELRRRFPALNVAVSLNAPDPHLRLRLMPGTRPWPLTDLLRALSSLPGRSRHPVTLEYVLLKGVNDQPAQAEELARLLRGKGMPVNLLTVNAVPGSAFEPPTPREVTAFAAVLAAAGVEVRRRRSRGADIEAACGQLREQAGADRSVAGRTANEEPAG